MVVTVVPLASIYALIVLITKAVDFHLIETKDVRPEYQLAREAISKWLQNAGIQEPVDIMESSLLSEDTELNTKQVHLQSL
jgi:hypothetical protein